MFLGLLEANTSLSSKDKSPTFRGVQARRATSPSSALFFKAQLLRFCWPVTFGDGEIFDVDVKDVAASAPQRPRRKSQQSGGSERSDTRAVQQPAPEAPSQEVTSCCRQS